MRLAARMLALAILCLSFSASALAQKEERTIGKIVNGATAAPGQLMQVYLSGASDRAMPPLAADRFEVLVIQDGVSHVAQVRSAWTSIANLSPSSARDKAPDSNEQIAAMQPVQVIMFTVPQKLHEGNAVAVVNDRGRRRDEFNFKVANQPPPPHIFIIGQVVTTLSMQIPHPTPEDLKPRPAPTLSFARGEETQLRLMPLIDPETPDSAVLVTFKQGAFQREVKATVTRGKAIDASVPGTITFAPDLYTVSVRTPQELEVGPAEIEVRLRANGLTSEPGKEKAVIIDTKSADGAQPVAPPITNLGKSRIGIGQLVQVAIENARWLEPDPMKTMVVLEQGARRLELKPELNSSKYASRSGQMMPVVLTARVNDTVIGEAMVRVYNPARGEQAGLSEGVQIEIINEVLPPAVINVTETSKQDIAMLSAMREAALKVGHDLREYNPRYRYVTIRATGLDYNPNFVRIQFQQGGRTFILAFADFSLTAGDKTVVRLPDEIKPGLVQVTIQNKGMGRLSEPVNATLEVKQAGTQ